MMLLSAFVLGLFSTPHCVGMCGGLLSAMTFKLTDKRPTALMAAVFKYNFGRMISYALLGLVAGIVGHSFVDIIPQASVGLRLLAGILLIASGLYIGQWWMGLRHVEQLFSQLWSRSRKRFMPSSGHFLTTGMIWGCIPCGLVYTALGLAMGQQSIWLGSAFMLAFGAGTLPVLFFVGMASANVSVWLKSRMVTTGVGMALIAYGIWTIQALY